MARYAIDRRVARTRAMLHRALCSLIFKKGYEAISIRDICNAANVGRSTFYAHYTSKDDLKRCGFEPLRRLLLERQRDALTAEGELRDRRFGFTLAMFEHARDHRNHYRALVGNRGGVVSLGTIRKILSEVVRDELAATSGKNSTDTIARELAVEFVVGAFLAVMTWWLDGGATLPPRQVDAMFRRLAIEGATPSYS